MCHYVCMCGCSQYFIVGTGRGLDQLCGVESVCGSCVWETGPPLFSYIVPLLLQTVNSTKDAQAIVGKTAEERMEGVGGLLS